MDRPFRCNCVCCTEACDGFLGQEIQTLSSNGQFLGKAVQESSCHFIVCCADWILTLHDDNNQPKYKLENNICKAICDCFNDKYLYLNDLSGNQVGLVTKKYRGCCTECCTSADTIFIQFPKNASAADKANIISAVMLSDYNLWEQSSQ